ncbi:MAG: DUF3298 domain-containing protein [Lachnospiraceae bacterium]|nr:DUF3298 domain-containing protein [Lachnospiraceae bacterium]
MKKRVLSLLLVMILVIGVFAGCGKKENAPAGNDTNKTADANNDNNDDTNADVEEEVKLLHVYKEKYSDSEGAVVNDNWLNYARMYYEKLKLTKEDAEKYAALAKGLEDYGNEIGGLVEETYNDCKEFAKDDMAQGATLEYGEYFIERYMNVCRADEHVLSAHSTFSSYTGGAHGYGADYPVNFDVETGKRLEFKDVVKDLDAMYKLVEEKVREQYADSLDMFFNFESEDPFADFKSGEYEQAFLIDYDGINVIYNPYDIAAYAAGQQVIKIPFKGNENLFEEKYFTDVPESYVIEISENGDFTIDLDGDGTEETVSLWSEYDMDSYQLNAICFYINNNEYKFENDTTEEYLDSFEGRVFIFKTKEGKVFCYYLGRGCNDYETIAVFEIKKDGISAPKFFYGGLKYPDVIEDGSDNIVWAEGCITDMEHMEFDTRTDIFGTTSVYKTYHLGADGMPETNDEYWAFVSKVSYKVLKSIKVEIIDEAGNKTGERELAAGEEVTPYRTDNESILDMKDKDGNILRVKVTNEWPYEIDGVEMQEIFENIIYAG